MIKRTGIGFSQNTDLSKHKQQDGYEKYAPKQRICKAFYSKVHFKYKLLEF